MALQQSIQNYFSALNSGDREGWLATFSDRPELRHADPVNGPARTTKTELGGFFDQMLGLFAEVRLEVESWHAAGPEHVALTFQGKGKGRNGAELTFGGIDVFWGDAEGKIVKLEAYWDANATVARLLG